MIELSGEMGSHKQERLTVKKNNKKINLFYYCY